MKVVPIGSLTGMFRKLVEEYAVESAGEEGETLDSLLDDAWQVFDDRLLEGNAQKRRELLLAILEYRLDPRDDVDQPDYRTLFVPRAASGLDLQGAWDNRLDALLESPPGLIEDGGSGAGEQPFDSIADAVESAGLEFTIRQPLFRARIHKDRSSTRLIPLAEMGAPPPERVRAARANRTGQPVLYLASDNQTALAEVRAWKGAVVAVAEMGLQRPLRILNLVKVPPLGSPFEVADLAWLLDARALLHRFGRELSRPIIPGEEESEYGPSQHICDVARKAGFDGIAYPSAMGHGHNIVLFNPNAATPTSMAYCRVERPSFKVAPYTHAEMHWEE